MSFKRTMANFLSPPQCVLCSAPLEINAEVNLCGGCEIDAPLNDGKCCQICGVPLDIAYGDLYCGMCKSYRRAFARNVSMYIYKDSAAEALRCMKFGAGQIWIADTFGRLLANSVATAYDGIGFGGAVFVPVSKKRMRERGFNQSEIIAEAVCQRLGLPKLCVLDKLRDTPKQSSLKYEQRLENVKGAFAVRDAEKITDKTLLLIDDICTTGSTLHECARMLKKAGAAVVYCATVANTEIGK